MLSKFEITSRITQTYIYDKGIKPPEPFLDQRYTALVEILHNALPQTQLVMIGFWPTYDHHPLDPDTVIKMGAGKQNLDIDMFLPVSRTDQEYWDRIQTEGYPPHEHNQSPDTHGKIIPVGNNLEIVFWQGFTFISPRLSQLGEDQLKPILSQALFDHLPPEHRFQKVGRTGDQLIVIGEGAADWGINRREQPTETAKPYIEIMPLFVNSPHEEYLNRTLEKYGYSSDLKPVYCRTHKRGNIVDLHLRQPEYASWMMYGLPTINLDYVKTSPTNALNWIRREVKAIALYTQLTDNSNIAQDFIKNQLFLLTQHVELIQFLMPEIKYSRKLVDKVNQSFGLVAEVLEERFCLKANKILLSQPQNS